MEVIALYGFVLCYKIYLFLKNQTNALDIYVPLDQEYFCVHDNDNLKNVLAKPLRFLEEEKKKKR